MAPKRSYDDLETDYLEEENESGFLSLVSVVIAFIAVAVFIALAWYAYQSNTGSKNGGEIEVVYPEEGPVREAPEESGGWQFPHQDKAVYDIVSGESKEEEDAKVEQILPAPEQAMERPEAETKTWMSDKLKQEPIAKTDAERRMEESTGEAKPAKEEAAKEAARNAKEEISGSVPVASPQKHEAVAVEAPKKETPKKEEPKPVVAEEKPAPVATPVVSPAPEAAAPVVSSGNAAIQLGAVRSEADAQAQWKRLQGKYSSHLAGKTLNIQKAEIPGKGTFYRIQAKGYASKADAAAACKKLSAAGQPCFAVGK